MRTFVESLKRLYENGSKAATKEKMLQLKDEGKLTEEELAYILGE